jgi:hypothetical protein
MHNEICPKCGEVYSPEYSKCPFCENNMKIIEEKEKIIPQPNRVLCLRKAFAEFEPEIRMKGRISPEEMNQFIEVVWHSQPCVMKYLEARKELEYFLRLHKCEDYLNKIVIEYLCKFFVIYEKEGKSKGIKDIFLMDLDDREKPSTVVYVKE